MPESLQLLIRDDLGDTASAPSEQVIAMLELQAQEPTPYVASDAQFNPGS